MSWKNWTEHGVSAAAIRDVEDGQENPLNGKPFTSRHTEIVRRRRETLPLYQGQHQQAFLDNLKDGAVTIFTGNTGSGKTTQIPQWVIWAFLAGMGKSGRKIACTQPRRAAAMQVAARVAAELDVKLGKEVGVHVRNNKQEDDTTRLLFATDGMLVNLMKRDPSMSKYGCLILDETHERTASTDIIMGVVKDLMVHGKRAPKLILMSATLTTEMFQRYFAGAKIQQVPGVTFGVQIFYLRNMSHLEPLENAVHTVLHIHMREDAGDILVFLPTHGDCAKLVAAVNKAMHRGYANTNIVGDLSGRVLTGNMSPSEQDAVLTALPPTSHGGHGRKLIAATNVAETSLTIDGVSFVVDTMQVNTLVYDPSSRVWHRHLVPISKHSATQRAGRAGRLAPGKVYRMCTEAEYILQHEQSAVPKILEGPLEQELLTLIDMKKNPMEFDLPQPPATESILRGLEELYFLEVIDGDGGLTHLGKLVATLSLPPHHAVALLQSQSQGCSSEVLTILAMLEAVDGRRLWSSPSGDTKAYDDMNSAKGRLKHPRGGLLTLFNIFMGYKSAAAKGRGAEFCQTNSLLKATLDLADKTRARLFKSLQSKVKIVALQQNDRHYYKKILLALCHGFFLNSARRHAIGKEQLRPNHAEEDVADTYFTTYTNVKCEVPKYQTLSESVDGDFVIYDKAIASKSVTPDLVWATAVPREYLLAGGPGFWHMESFPPGPIREAMIKTIRDLTGMSDAKVRGGMRVFTPSD